MIFYFLLKKVEYDVFCDIQHTKIPIKIYDTEFSDVFGEKIKEM